MKACSVDLADFLASVREYAKVDVISFELAGGTDDRYRLFYTSGQNDLTVVPVVGGPALRTYRANQVTITGLRAKAGIGLAVDEQTAVLTPLAGALVQQLTVQEAVRRRIFDNAIVRRDRFYYERFGQGPIGGLPMFAGVVSTARQAGASITMKVKSAKVLLVQPMPRHLNQPTCVWTVYGPGCDLDTADFAVAGAVGASPTRSRIPWAAASADYALGSIFFEDMGDVGQKRTIRDADATGLDLAYPLPQDPVAAEAFVACPGCDGSLAACTRFSNTDHLRSYPFVPNPEDAV